MRVPDNELAKVPGLIRCEDVTVEEIMAQAAGITKESYSHDEVYGDFCTLQTYIDCPPEELYRYLADMYSQEEFTYSVRDMRPVDDTGLYVGRDAVAPDDGTATKIYVRIHANPDAMTVDYHAAWDQGDDLWMIYLYRVVPAQLVFGKPGSVLLWTNCHHPYYKQNPYPELSPRPDGFWVGDLWPFFYAGHLLELENLKAIVEYRHREGIPIVPAVERDAA